MTYRDGIGRMVRVGVNSTHRCVEITQAIVGVVALGDALREALGGGVVKGGV